MKSPDSGRSKRLRKNPDFKFGKMLSVRKKFVNPEGVSGYYVDPEFDAITITRNQILQNCKIYTPEEYQKLLKKKSGEE